MLMGIAVALSALAVFGVSGTASASPPATAAKPAPKVITPQGCQGANVTLTLETSRQGYNYTCSGQYFNAAGSQAFYVFPGAWSGFVQGTNGVSYLFCDFQNRSLPNPTVSYIYLSSTKEPWC